MRVGLEACDDGGTSNSTKCQSDCSGPVNGWLCVGGSASGPSTCTEVCGDGFYTMSEGCDDFNTFDGDGCSSTCIVELGFLCDNTVSPSDCNPVCGDSRKVNGETCDDGNTSNADKCKADCTGPVSGWTCSGGTSTSPSVCLHVCGDGIIVLGEACDDQNT